MDGAGSDLDFSHRRVIAGIVVQSLALLADAAHLFTDAAALAIAVAAVRIARRPADAKCTYGYHRFEILAAAFNAALLFGVALYILCEAYRRFNAPAEGQPLGMLIVATLVLAVDLLNTRFLQAGKDTSRNVKGAYLEVWADMLGSFGVIVAALVIRFTGPAWVDTLAAVGMGLWVLPRTWVLLKESLTILLEGAPEGVDVDEVGRTMLAVPGVTGGLDLHVWMLTSSKNALTAHVIHAAGIDGASLIALLKEMLADRFKSSTRHCRSNRLLAGIPRTVATSWAGACRPSHLNRMRATFTDPRASRRATCRGLTHRTWRAAASAADLHFHTSAAHFGRLVAHFADHLLARFARTGVPHRHWNAALQEPERSILARGFEVGEHIGPRLCTLEVLGVVGEPGLAVCRVPHRVGKRQAWQRDGRNGEGQHSRSVKVHGVGSWVAVAPGVLPGHAR